MLSDEMATADTERQEIHSVRAILHSTREPSLPHDLAVTASVRIKCDINFNFHLGDTYEYIPQV